MIKTTRRKNEEGMVMMVMIEMLEKRLWFRHRQLRAILSGRGSWAVWRGVNTNSRPNTHKLPVGPKPRLRFFSGTFDSPFFIVAHTERVPDRRLALWLEAILGCGWLDGGGRGGWGVGVDVEMRGIGLRFYSESNRFELWTAFGNLKPLLLILGQNKTCRSTGQSGLFNCCIIIKRCAILHRFHIQAHIEAFTLVSLSEKIYYVVVWLSS